MGVVEDGKYVSLMEDLRPAVFLPILQSPTSRTWLVVRANHDSPQLATAIERTLRDLDPGLPFSVETGNSALNLALFPARMASVSLSVLGAIGAMLCVTGLFGMASYAISKRRRELGIRIALGGRRREVLSAALGRATKLLALGSAAGLL